MLPGVSAPKDSSVRDVQVWGSTGVSEPSFNWASESLNKERKTTKKDRKDRKKRKKLRKKQKEIEKKR